MNIIGLISKLIPEGNFKDFFRFPVYWFLNKIKFIKRELTLYKKIKGFFYFAPKEKAEEINEIKDYLKKYDLKKGDSVIDCGAYRGYFTVLASKLVGKKGKIVAIEPDPSNVIQLKKNIKANKLKNVVVIQKGLSNKEAKVGWSMGGIISQVNKSKVFKIKTTTIDNIFKKLRLNNVSFIKMDIEGAEIEALNGATRALRHTKNLAIASYHIVNGEKTCFAVERILNRNNFKVRTEDVGQLITFARLK
jgi:FkbM family methyltransferase